ncbi:MAG TPA: alpha-amylase family glycosyl hydrolase [Chiayiivirga sp.]|uniref:Alpha-amylase family glycosyl hydrolase n=1 Tax=Denitratimonas tolerans TaxID=1338420 RepID=A0AAW9R3D1_9GAMM|nr:alpha-amylase family glycosyl hydrolase [Xanthomonadaceae bacterium]HRN58769.1 alpha-amylase family glycosyl hydrolase [Chiayiivirga sp.]HRO86847.1 alpha-amylase family glycosyl hydrolase [Chiayiivirga sp.]HRQ34003.1 alpha-amylase family glycosyl hydrolase [Chiayiivirga sp.]
MFHFPRILSALACAVALAACAPQAPDASATSAAVASYYGTLEPFAREAVYFVMTDRFVNGDPANDQRDQGTFDIPLVSCSGVAGNIGYLGGDFRGLADHLDYIAEMGFTAVWITPVVDNPDEPFSGGTAPTCGGSLADRGKTGYHGYWGVDFNTLDEHLPSPGMGFRELADALHAHGMKLVLDIVGNHGSPAWGMEHDQPKFGKIFDRDGTLLADHQNLDPTRLDPAGNPLHRFYSARGPVEGEGFLEGNLAQLSDFDADNPAVLDYLVDAYSGWIEQGADAFRIDTIAWMPDAFWQAFTQRIRAKRPGFFMFGEAFNYDAEVIARHTLPGQGETSVLDFPMKEAMEAVFGHAQAGFARLAPALYLTDGPYANPYDLATFYDNHDMPRLDASDAGFIDAHHWLFTARGIPVVYYGSEMGFMRGRPEHGGNRNYFGVEGIEAARTSPIRAALIRIARARAASPALQRGLQVNLELNGTRAAFYRVYQHQGEHQIALVLLNKGDAAARFAVDSMLQAGRWTSALDGGVVEVAAGGKLEASVPAHGVQVYLLDAAVTEPTLVTTLDAAMARARPQR